MATAEGIKTLSVQSGEALPIYRFLQLQSDGQHDLGGAAGDDERCDGVSAQAASAAGETIAMAELQGVMKVEAGEAIAVGALVAAEQATGKALTASAAGSGNYSLGVARTAASADGEVIEVHLHLAANQA